MIWNLLEGEANTGSTATGGVIPNYVIWIILGVIVILFVVYFVFSSRKNKQRRQEYTEQIDAIKPGNKVKTTGGICGIVAEVCDDDTIVIETGTEQSGKSYVKIDKECIYQTDAKGPTQLAREEAEARRKAEKEAKDAAKKGETPEAPAASPAEAPAETAGEAPAEEQPAAAGQPEEKQE